jgi:hypothetical protein
MFKILRSASGIPKKLFLQVGLVLILALSVYAQVGSTGSVSGTVTDPGGGVVPNATVKLTSELNGDARSTKTSETGAFFFGALTPGPYTVRVDATGFRSREQKNNNLLSAARLEMGQLALEVGSVTESVEVTAQAAAVATSTSAQTSTIDSGQMDKVPVRGRDPMSVLKTLPGVQIIADQDTWGGSFQSTVPQFQGRGGNTIYTDGVNGGDGNGGGNFSGITSIDAIAEVNIQANSYTAEYGLKGGAQINLVTKHGGSEFHGTAAWYKRHEMFNAQNFFNNRTNTRKPLYRYSDWSGTLGGPVPYKIPILNRDGKSMNFFFSVEDMRLKNVQPLRFFTMPTALERNGDFSQTRTPGGALIPVLNPAANQTPFPGNLIPQSLRSDFGTAYLNMFPLPNTVGASGYNYTTQEPSIDHPRRATLLRVDLRPTSKDTISIKRQTWFTRSVGWEVAQAPGGSRWGMTRQRYDFSSDQGKLEYTRVISPNLINEMSIGIFYSTESGPPDNDLALASIQKAYDRAAALGDCAPPRACTANGTLKPGPLAGLRQINPAINPLGIIPKAFFGTLQNASQAVPEINYDNRYPLSGEDTAMPITNNTTYTKGKHTVKFGALRVLEAARQARASTFAGQFNFQVDGNDPLNTNYAYANAYTGHVQTYTESMGRPPNPNRRQYLWSWYVQDTWKIRKNITLDFGLRMYKWAPILQGGGEASAFAFERFDPKWGGRPPVLYQPTLVGTARRALNPQTNQVLPAPFIGLMIPGTGYTCGAITAKAPCKINGVVVQDDPTFTNVGNGFWDQIPLQFDPRFGVAWDPFSDGKMAVRFGAGVYHDASYSNTFVGGPSFLFDQVIRYTDLNSYFLGSGPTSPANVAGTYRTGQKLPNTYQYNFGVQREIGFKTVLDVAYAGSLTKHQAYNFNPNILPRGIRFQPASRDLTRTPTAANPGAQDDVFLRPIQGFNDINITGYGYSGRYDSLQVSANRRFSQGLMYSVAYTWAGGTQNHANGNGTQMYQQLDPVHNRSRNTLVNQHAMVVSYTLDIPKTSQRIMNNAVGRQILDRWQLLGVSTFATGQLSNVTFSTSDNFDFSGGGEVCGTGIVQTGNATLPRGERGVDNWFNTGVFQRPSGRGDIGNNCHNGKFKQPGFHNHDMSIRKVFPIAGEKRYLEFKGEAFNVFNHTQFASVGTAALFNATGGQTNTTFGRVTSAREARRLVMGLKFVF